MRAHVVSMHTSIAPRPSWLLAALLLAGPLAAQETPHPVVAASAGHSADELAKQLANPVAALISLPIQENIDFGYANDGWKSTTNIQPVVPFSLSEDWNLISRTILPFNI